MGVETTQREPRLLQGFHSVDLSVEQITKLGHISY